MSGYDYLALCAAKKTIFGEENILGKNLNRKKKLFVKSQHSIISYALCFWASDTLIDSFLVKFYECNDLTTQVYIFFDTDLR